MGKRKYKKCLQKRVRYRIKLIFLKHIRMKKYFLIILFAIISSCNNKQADSKQIIDKPKPKYDLTVGVFNGDGAGSVSVIETLEALKIDPKIKPVEISASEIMQGGLNNIDVIIFPGGSGSKELNNLGKLGQEKVKEFIKKGNGAVGICAGAYLFCSTPTYPSLQIADVKHLDRAHYSRGRGLIEFQLSEEGYKLFPELKGHQQFIQYYDGPIMEALHHNPSFVKLSEYKSDIHINKGTPVGLTPGKLFSYHENYGKGRILAIGGHAESTPGMRWMIPRMARWAGGKSMVKYDKKWIRPDINTKEIFFDTDLAKVEKENWWKLLSNKPNEQIEAMNKLHALRSRPFVRWNIGLLRDKNPEVRANAAKILAETEYTDALDDLKTAYKLEKNAKTKEVMKNALDFLK